MKVANTTKRAAIVCRFLLPASVALLTACGGGSGDSNGSTAASQSGNGTSAAPISAPVSHAYFAVVGTGSVYSMINKEIDQGPEIQWDRKIDVLAEGDTSARIRGLALDTKNDLLYALDSSHYIAVFSNAATANGRVTPLQKIGPVVPSRSGSRLNGLAIDSSRGLLYLADTANNVKVYRINETGVVSATPIRNLVDATVENDKEWRADKGYYLQRSVNTTFVVDSKRDIGYFGVTYTTKPGTAIHAFKNVSALDGQSVPDQTFDLADPVDRNPTDIKINTPHFIDAATDTLYFGYTPGGIAAVHNASTKNGRVTANRYIDIAEKVWMQPYVDSANDRLYATGTAGLLVFNQASTLSGTAKPIVKVAPNNAVTDPVVVRQ